MIGFEKPEEMSLEARRKELAELLAKGFLRLRRRIDYPEIMRQRHDESTCSVPDTLPENSSQNNLIIPAQPSVHWSTD